MKLFNRFRIPQDSVLCLFTFSGGEVMPTPLFTPAACSNTCQMPFKSDFQCHLSLHWDSMISVAEATIDFWLWKQSPKAPVLVLSI